MVRIALVGTGWHGQGHLQTMKNIDSIDVVGICDLNKVMLYKAANKFKVTPFEDYIRMLEETKPDGVIIVTPASERVGLVQIAATRGIHCFIEKPPAKNIKTADKVNQILADNEVMSSVGFMYRYSKAVEKCKKIISGRKIHMVRSAMLDGIALRKNWPNWFFDKDKSGGPVLDQAIHIFDLSRYILGEVTTVAGAGDNKVKAKSDSFSIEDSFSLLLNYGKTGPLQTHHHSWVHDGHICEMEFISHDLRLTLDIGNGTLSGIVDGEEISYHAKEESLYQLELEAFSLAIKEGRPDSIKSTYRDSIKSLSVTLAMLDAIEHKEVVNLKNIRKEH